MATTGDSYGAPPRAIWRAKEAARGLRHRVLVHAGRPRAATLALAPSFRRRSMRTSSSTPLPMGPIYLSLASMGEGGSDLVSSRLLARLFLWFLFAIVSWLTDNIACAPLQALPVYPQLHALGWHLGTATGLPAG